MKVSGFTIVRNAVRFHYPAVESIRSILPLCDEFIVNVGDSQDDTLDLIKSLNDPKIKIIEHVWDMSMGKEVLSCQTNLALKECRGDWALYLQSDEVIHEDDLERLRDCMLKYASDKEVDALRFQWLHFYGSYYRYRIDRGWYQKQDRIIRNNGQIESFGDAFGFRRKDGQPLHRGHTRCLLYHYGWVHPPEIMMQRRRNAEDIGFVELSDEERQRDYDYGRLKRYQPYFGSHPAVMEKRVKEHGPSQRDWEDIIKRYWWHPWRIFRMRYKTCRRIKETL